MTDKEARKLNVGDKISTSHHPEGEFHVGEIIDTGYHAVTVKWDDGQTGTVHILDMATFDQYKEVR